MPLRHFVIALAIALFVAPGCGGVVGPSQNTIVEFSDFVDPMEAGAQHEFSASRNGEFEIRFLTFAPSDAILQVDFGQFVGGSCQQLLGSSLGGQNTIVLTGAISPGRYCVQLFDTGLITQRVTYTIRVSHP
jgi:hypothetical protein